MDFTILLASPSHRRILILLLSSLTVSTQGQVADNFSDGDFFNNPVWAGNDAKFTINSGLLKLQAPAVAESAYLSTSSKAIHNASWEFYVQMDFNPSSTNFTRIYLTSNLSDLTQPLNGYYVMVGNTDDEISLYKQTGTTRTKIIDGLNGRVNMGTVMAKVKITRDATGFWELLSDVGLTGIYTSEGSTTDITHTGPSFFGVQCTYTSTRSSHFWFDDFVITGTMVPDLNPPQLASVMIVDQSNLLVAFNEEVENLTAQTITNYSINNGIGNPANAILQPDNKLVLLSLATPLTNGLNYSVQVSGVRDPDGNTMNTASTNFLYFIPQPVNKKDVIVSEFMADQTPVVGLPEAEFVELFNRSPNPINLLGWNLSDGPSSIATLPNFILLPNSYCIITSTSSANLFPGSIGVSNFPSLNNSGDNIIVRNTPGETIDSIHYSISWYNSDEKKDGGWSIEIIDPENWCGEENNWAASTHINGGTPGSINSVNGNNPDLTAPKIVSVQVVNSSSIEILFDEKMDGGGVQSISVPSIDFISANYSPSLRFLTLTSSSPFQTSTPYTITLSNVNDCSGNTLTSNMINFVLAEQALPGDVIVNEILFNPLPGGVDFVEVYNNTSKYLNLKRWSLANYDGSTISNSKSLGTGGILLFPNSYRVITSDSIVLKAQYPNTIAGSCINSVLPSFPDDNGSVALMDSLGSVMDYFIYNENYHSLTSAKEGVSLERISFVGLSNDPGNWTSATVHENFATPGYKNSAAYPFLTNFVITGPNALSLSFSSPLEATPAQSIINYSLNPEIGNPSAVELQNGNTVVRLTFAGIFSNGLNYVLTISGIKDPDGKTLPAITHNFLYFIPSVVKPKDIVVSEFMADPTPVVGLPEVEFVELFNRSSNPISLLGWKLSDGPTTATLPQYILLPSSRCVITTIAASGQFPGSIGVSGFPSLNNSVDNLILKNQNDVTIDSITYSLAWYHSDEKKDGGWSLEIVDPENLCEEGGNWTASENLLGGTPGDQNSVNANNPDLTAPLVLDVIVTSEASLEIVFDEKMDGLPSPGVIISPPINLSSIHYDASLRKLIIQASGNFERSTSYILTLSNLYDCSGNGLENNSFHFVLPEAAGPGDILINEILFNPKSGGVDFVEVYNRTNKYLSLKEGKLTNYQDGTVSNQKEITMTNPVIKPNSYQVFTSDVEILQSHYPRAVESVLVTTTLPSLPDDEGSIALVDSSGNILDHFNYTDDYHTPFLKGIEGVSLERISLEVETDDPDNWRSASQLENFATPGYKNSAAANGSGPIAGEVSVDPEIFSPEVPPNDFTKINYRFDQSGKVANATIHDHQGRLIKVLANNEVLGVDGFFRWDGDREGGGRARAGYYWVMVEVFDIGGTVSTFRKRIVIAY